MSRRGLLVPLRIGLRLEGGSYIPDPLLTAVEPPAARMLELSKLSGFPGRILYHASRNRQCHTYAVTERRDARSLALKRVFSRWADQHSFTTSPSKASNRIPIIFTLVILNLGFSVYVGLD